MPVSPDLRALPPLLLPPPRQVETIPGALIAVASPLTVAGVSDEMLACTLGVVSHCQIVASGARAWLNAHIDASNGQAQGYTLTIQHVEGSQTAAVLIAADEAGLRYGLHTLAQLLTQYGSALPPVRIQDHPRFRERGIMLDVSRDRVPTMTELHRLVALFASWKINHLQLYTEHTFAYRGHETVWEAASPLTSEDIVELDRLCIRHGIRLVANQNCFGHMERWLKHPRYRSLAEAETWTAFGQVRKYPFTLCPGDPGSIALVSDLLGQLLPYFSTRQVNIGCDETFDLGQGRSKAACEQHGKGRVYLDFVKQVCAIAAQHGCRPLLWADIALEHPELLGELPPDCIALAWNYEADAEFARWCQQLRAAKREVWVCPGTSSWCSLTGRSDVRHANLRAAADQGADHGATGYVITDWGDLGHRQTWPVCAIGLAEGALRAWSAENAAWDPRAASLHVFADRSLALAPWLDELGDSDRELRLRAGPLQENGTRRYLMNRTALFHDLHLPAREPWLEESQAWVDIRDRVRANPPPVHAPDTGSENAPQMDPLILRECHHTWQIALFAAERAVVRRSPTTTAEFFRLADELATLRDAHTDLWRQRSREGGLADSCAHYQRIIDDLQAQP